MVQPHLCSLTSGIKRGLGSHVHHLSSPMLVLLGPSNPSRGISSMLLSVAVFGYLEGSDISFRPCQDLSSPPVTPARWPVRVSCLSPCLMWWSFCSPCLSHVEAGPSCCCAPDFRSLPLKGKTRSLCFEDHQAMLPHVGEGAVSFRDFWQLALLFILSCLSSLGHSGKNPWGQVPRDFSSTSSCLWSPSPLLLILCPWTEICTATFP